MEYVTNMWNECWRCPVTLTIITIQLVCWSVTYKQNLSTSGATLKPYFLTYDAVVEKGEAWRCFTAPWLHSTLTHLLLDVVCLWSLRFLEYSPDDFSTHSPPPAQALLGRGSWYYFRYSLVLLLSSAAVTLLMVRLLLWRLQSLPGALRRVFGALPFLGYTPVVLAWSMVASMDAAVIETAETPVHLAYSILGLFEVPYGYMPLVLFVAAHLLVPRLGGGDPRSTSGGDIGEATAAVSLYHSTGFTVGLLLSGGLLAVCPSNYWTVCVVADVGLLVAFETWRGRDLRRAQRRSTRRTAGAGSGSGPGTGAAAAEDVEADIQAGLEGGLEGTDRDVEAAMPADANPIPNPDSGSRWTRFAVIEAGETTLLFLPALARHQHTPAPMQGLGSSSSSSGSDTGVEMRAVDEGSWLGRSWLGGGVRQGSGSRAGSTQSPDIDSESTGLLAQHDEISSGQARVRSPRRVAAMGGGRLMVEEEEDDEDASFDEREGEERALLR